MLTEYFCTVYPSEIAVIQAFVKANLSKHEYPREIEFLKELPKTPDGKIKRKELREREKKNKGL